MPRFRSHLRRLLPALLTLALPLAAAATNPVPAPELSGITRWINTPPLSMHALHGKVVLVDFWTFECINCLHALPQVESLYARYKSRGLVVIGVHTPELTAERDTGNLMNAVKRLGITYPVAQDNDNSVWDRWHNQYWPAQYLVDRQGRIVFSHVGEGGYADIEDAVREQLDRPTQRRPAPR